MYATYNCALYMNMLHSVHNMTLFLYNIVMS